MTYATGTYTDAADLLGKLKTFCDTTITTVWTIDDVVASDKFAMHLGNLHVSFRYDSLAAVGDRQIISLHQATAHVASADPGDHTDDSGSGYNATSGVTDTLLDDERHIDASRDAATNSLATYFFFEDDTTESYIHVVLQKADRTHHHFGFGNIEKFGTWTGGEYCHAQFVHLTGGIDPYDGQDMSVSLDGRASYNSTTGRLKHGHYATMHVEGFADQAGASKWGEVGVDTGSIGSDSAAVDRMKIQGGYRGGITVNALGAFPVGKVNGFYNLIPINLYAIFSAFDPSHAYYMGAMLDVRNIIMDGLTPGQEITDGADTWMVFPSFKKDGVGASSRSTLYQGIAYKKIV